MQRLIVIGGDAAGMSAASQIRRMQPLREITVYEKGPYTSYAACGIPYYIAGLVGEKEKLIARTPETFQEKYRISAQTEHEVLAISPEEHTVWVKNLQSGEDWHEPYDQLLLATGANPITTGFDGETCANVHHVNNLMQAEALEGALKNASARHALIVGGGYIGLEMAEALVMRGIRVTMIHRGRTVMSSLDLPMGELVGSALAEGGVDLRLNTSLEGFQHSDGRVTAVLTSTGPIATDLVILGIGVMPATKLAKEAGIELGEKDSIKVNELQQTSIKDIWAVGDCTQSFHVVSRRPVYVSMGTVANRQGRVAGINLGGGYATFPGVLGTSITKFMQTECARTGLNEQELRALGWKFATATIKTKTLPPYYPGATTLHVKVLAEKGSGRLLGVQIVGGTGSAKRIDTAAVALHAGMDVETFINLDLSYAPPFSGVWDPIITAAKQVLKDI